MPSSSSAELATELRRVSTSADMRWLLARYEATDLQAAWSTLSPAERGALLLMRNFNGTILHDFDISGS